MHYKTLATSCINTLKPGNFREAGMRTEKDQPILPSVLFSVAPPLPSHSHREEPERSWCVVSLFLSLYSGPKRKVSCWDVRHCFSLSPTSGTCTCHYLYSTADQKPHRIKISDTFLQSLKTIVEYMKNKIHFCFLLIM